MERYGSGMYGNLQGHIRLHETPCYLRGQETKTHQTVFRRRSSRMAGMDWISTQYLARLVSRTTSHWVERISIASYMIDVCSAVTSTTSGDPDFLVQETGVKMMKSC